MSVRKYKRFWGVYDTDDQLICVTVYKCGGQEVERRLAKPEQAAVQSFPPRFPLGQLVTTPGALQALLEAGQSPTLFLNRHLSGDWGEVTREDKLINDRALREGSRLFSAYRLASGATIWLITEADRSATTFLLPEEY